MELNRKIYPGINYSDPTFRADDAAQYTLNIFLNDSQFLFSIVDASDKSIKHVQSFNFFQVNNSREFADSVKMILDSEDLFFHNYNKCNVAFYHEQSTLIPSELFDAQKVDSYLELNTEKWDDADASYDTLTANDVVNVYSVSNAVKKLLKDKFSNVNFLHASTPLLTQLLLQSEQTEPALFVYVQPRVLEVLYAKKGKPVFFNSFHYTTPEDFIYYILYVCQHLHLDPEKVHVHLHGEIVKDSVLYEFTYKYIRHVHFAKRPDGIKISDSFNMPEHFYYNLFCIGL